MSAVWRSKHSKPDMMVTIGVQFSEHGLEQQFAVSPPSVFFSDLEGGKLHHLATEPELVVIRLPDTDSGALISR